MFNLKKIGYKPIPDHDFQMYLEEIAPQVINHPLFEQISTLARYDHSLFTIDYLMHSFSSIDLSVTKWVDPFPLMILPHSDMK